MLRENRPARRPREHLPRCFDMHSHSRLTPLVAAIVAFGFAGATAVVTSPSAVGEEMASGVQRVPVTVSFARNVYKATVMVSVGNLRAVPIAIDTGSVGLRLFAFAGVGSKDSGTTCSDKQTSVLFSNPPRIGYHGVLCTGYVHIGSATTQQAIPFELERSAFCPDTNPDCRLASNDPARKAAAGTYGVLGVGIARDTGLPSPFRMMGGPVPDAFSLTLSTSRGEVAFGVTAPAGATIFPAAASGNGTLGLPVWAKPTSCLIIDGRLSTTCISTTFDTGDPAGFIHTPVPVPGLPVLAGNVTPGTRIGFAPQGQSNPATTFVAGAETVRIAVAQLPALVNAGIHVFFDHTFTYDGTHGTIAVSDNPQR
jgi:hypothetical protein